ncbi:Dam family site-specific DNA-(adenine-N6)-methyltransferase [Stenomitos frigidus]|uniref:Site-specific DNA-methyltransferase (adenine-specific) n=1 Tax=Stenomitos frigidus ULC18 TaxID=2107698 RepID=A0A2T1DVM8_9CYAN|nr:Dam family site-specific DNA-(adenine-N6)-methyltransferase [Stenomitos frigidus]PSB24540.1 DNA adenine methylase [Stenomitos frigidus ULC18]
MPVNVLPVKVPPIKCQGIKTKLVPFILSQIHWVEPADSKWIEPFVGSGVVVFNRAPQRALIADSNQHIIRLYQGIQMGEIDRAIVSDFLQRNGEMLLRSGADYYYEVRDRFNQYASPLDFLFLNRACFNGLMRFNRKGGFNVPFCRKPQRFAQSYITKIANQVDWVAKQMAGKDWEFRIANWQDVLLEAQPGDFVYLDPPYCGRHTDYYNAWSQAEAEALAIATKQLPCGFAVSMWLENQHRKNSHIQDCWSDLEMRVCQHFYHVGAREALRGAIAEALLIKPGFATGNGRSSLK